MNKIELNRLSQVNNNEQNFLAALNENLKRIQEAINDTLSRTGVKPNQMEEVLDMNGNRICNVGPAVELTDVVTKQDIQNIIDAANEAIARLDGLVEAGRIALMNYAQEYIYPTVTAALDGAQAAQRAAEQARDALVLDPGYQAVVANLTNLLALANDLANVDTLVNNLTNIDTVANNITDVSTVAGISSAVSTLAGMTSTLESLVADLTNIDTVAGNIADVNTVAGLSSAVAALADISNELTALYNNITAINAVYADLTKIDAVEGKLTEIEAVYAALSDISAVEDALTDLTNIADNLTALLSIVTNMTSLLAVSNDLTNLDAIAADLTNLDAVASNLAAILAAPTYASQAAASASNAQIWAEGSDSEVVPLGGQHSAKVWAQYVEEIIAGTRIYGGTFDSTTATATLTSSAKAKLGITSDTIVLTNDSTAVTGYAANEGIEYYVAVDGTFASLTLHEGDILWSTGSAWKKIDNAATEIPDATESVKGIAALATTAEAEAGANDTKIMTPLKTKQAILELAPAPADASESTKGIVELANESEATGGSNDTKAITPETAKKAIAAQTYNSLSTAQRTTLLSNGTYKDDVVSNGKIFETDSGKFESFTDTVSPPTITTAAVSMQSYPRIAYGSGMFILARGNDMTYAYYSTTGESGTWYSRDLPTKISFIRYHNDRFMAYSAGMISAGVQICHSTDGVNWETFASPWNKYGAISSAYGNGTYVLLGNSDYSGYTSYSKVAYSKDNCATWSSVNLPANSTWISVTYGNGVFVAVSNDSATAAYSEDGVTWNSFQMPSSGWYRILFGNGVFVAFRTYTNAVAYSTDGIHWTETTLPASANWGEIAYGDGTFVIIARLNEIFAYSTDGIHWLQGTMPQNTSWYGVAYGAGKFIASNNYNNNGAKITFEIIHTYSLTPLSYTKSEVDTALSGKQGTLSAGTGISISSDTVTATAMTGADGTNAGTLGAVPAPAATDNTKFLRGDGTWAEAAQEPAYDSGSMTIQL